MALPTLATFLGLLCAGAAVIVGDQGAGEYKLTFGDHNETFQEWKTKFAHIHGDDWDEDARFSIFSQNLATMESHNLLYHTKQKTFHMGLNQFSAMTHTEYQQYNHLGEFSSKSEETTRANPAFQCGWMSFANVPNSAAPPSLDWRAAGYVTPVKDQGRCETCTLFSASGVLEGAYFKAHKVLKSFSEQQVLNCCTMKQCANCEHGGWAYAAYVHVHDAGGLATEQDYPYTGRTSDVCRIGGVHRVGNLSACYQVSPVNDETALKKASALYGPIAVSIDFNHYSFQHYTGGVYYEPTCSNDINLLTHSVLVVGYGSMGGQDYWLVKNSWGTAWGQQGYIMMSRNRNNACGIADLATFAVFR